MLPANRDQSVSDWQFSPPGRLRVLEFDRPETEYSPRKRCFFEKGTDGKVKKEITVVDWSQTAVGR